MFNAKNSKTSWLSQADIITYHDFAAECINTLQAFTDCTIGNFKLQSSLCRKLYEHSNTAAYMYKVVEKCVLGYGIV